MTTEHLYTTLAVFALVWAFGAFLGVAWLGKGKTRRPIFYAAMSLLALLGMIWLNTTISLGRNAAVFLFDAVSSGDLRYLSASGLGFCLGLGPALWPWQTRWSRPARRWQTKLRRTAGLLAILGSFFFLAAFALHDQIKPFFVNRNLGSILANPGAFYTAPNFLLEEYRECEFHPVQITVGPAGDLYATGYLGVALQRGLVARISRDDATDEIVEAVIARNLSRPHGLAFHEGELYVSRSGQYSRAVSGMLRGVNTGAVTMMRDTNGDGQMDYFLDVVTDLPGAQGPDPLHQNNGIAFGLDGKLYVTIGGHSDRGPAVSQLEGTILCSRPDGSERTVFARGLRNPFDLVFGPDGELFCTDNDPSRGGRGDELNHVVADGHYGFPYANGSRPHPEGSVPPFWVHRHGSLQGVAYTDSTKLPAAFRNCLYVVSYGSGEIWRITLHRHEKTYRAEPHLFARIPHALDIAISEDGHFYVSCFRSKKIYRLTLKP